MASTTPNPTSAWTPEAVRHLGLTTDVVTAAAILGIGRTKAYELARNGEFPVTIMRIGRRYLVPTKGLLAVLGAE
jgi:excisionase family DNA binding protein